MIRINGMDFDESIAPTKLQHFIGIRWHENPEIGMYELRMSRFSFRYSPRPMQLSSKWKFDIPIPFMRNDHGIYIR